MADRKRKYPGIKGRRPDKKFARGVRAKINNSNSVRKWQEVVGSYPIPLDADAQVR